MRRFIPFLKSEPVVAVVRLQGAIMASTRGGGLNDAGMALALDLLDELQHLRRRLQRLENQ